MGEDQNLRRCILEMNGDEQELVALRIESQKIFFFSMNRSEKQSLSVIVYCISTFIVLYVLDFLSLKKAKTK